jgi:hypothetical protein
MGLGTCALLLSVEVGMRMGLLKICGCHGGAMLQVVRCPGERGSRDCYRSRGRGRRMGYERLQMIIDDQEGFLYSASWVPWTPHGVELDEAI